MPGLAIGGDHNMGDEVARILQSLKDWRHWVAEEQAEQLAEQVSNFLGRAPKSAMTMSPR